MKKSPRERVRFDVPGTMRRIHSEAISAGAPRGGSVQSTAMAHVHGLEPGGCTKFPCKLAGLCCALRELVQHEAECEHLAEFLAAAEETERLRKTLRRVRPSHAAALTALRASGTDRHRLERQWGVTAPMHAHELQCSRPLTILNATRAFLTLLEQFETDLRERAWSRDLQQAGGKRRGDLLLTAVCQHLKWGGLTYAEIADLVGEHGKGADERVRKRVKSSDERSVLPREEHPDFRRTPTRKPEKRRRRDSST